MRYMVTVATIVIIILVWGAFPGRWTVVGSPRRSCSWSPALFPARRCSACSTSRVESEAAQRVTEVALVLLLFSDAARLDLRPCVASSAGRSASSSSACP